MCVHQGSGFHPGSQDQVVLEGLGLRILIIGDRTKEIWDSRIWGQDEGFRDLQKASGHQSLVLEIQGPGNLGAFRTPSNEEMTEETKRHSPHPDSIPDLKEGASPATAVLTSPSPSDPQSGKAHA